MLASCAAASPDDVAQEVRLAAEEGGVRLTEAEGGHRMRLEHRISVTVVVHSMPCISFGSSNTPNC